MDDDERILAALAMGRIFKIMSRPYRPGDEEEYERCRAIIMGHVDAMPDIAPSIARDYGRGAAGQWGGS